MDSTLLKQNEACLDEPCDADTEQVEVLIKCLKDVQRTAQDTDPISDCKLVHTNKEAIEKTGKFQDQLRTWRNTFMPAPVSETVKFSHAALYSPRVST